MAGMPASPAVPELPPVPLAPPSAPTPPWPLRPPFPPLPAFPAAPPRVEAPPLPTVLPPCALVPARPALPPLLAAALVPPVPTSESSSPLGTPRVSVLVPPQATKPRVTAPIAHGRDDVLAMFGHSNRVGPHGHEPSLSPSRVFRVPQGRAGGAVGRYSSSTHAIPPPAPAAPP